MQNNYAATHRPKREDAKAKELADLKRENFELKRAVKRLQKDIAKRSGMQEELAEQGFEVEVDVEVQVESKACPCGSVTPLKQLTLNGKVYAICIDCKARSRIGEASE